MSAPVIAFFNNKGGVGKTTLVYHLAWMYADLGVRVLAADMDPQANLTAAFLDEDTLDELWESGFPTVAGLVDPPAQGTGDIGHVKVFEVDEKLTLLLGDLRLSRFEGHLSDAWPRCPDGDPRAFRIMSAFYRIMQEAARLNDSGLILMDPGPDLGAINRSALIAADYAVFPLSGDLFSLQGLRNLGPTLARWRGGWRERISKNPVPDLPLPQGRIKPVGYIVLQHSVRLDRPVRAYEKWMARIPSTYWLHVLGQDPPDGLELRNDEHCLALLKHYRSLMPMAQEDRKPMFHLKPADGAIGAHFQAARMAYTDFKQLAGAIAGRIGLRIPVAGYA